MWLAKRWFWGGLMVMALSSACGSEMGGDAMGGDYGGSIDPAESEEPVLPEAGQLTAGEWSDLANWNYWLELLQTNTAFQTAEENWQIRTQNRIAVRVVHDGVGISDAKVRLVDDDMNEIWDTRTTIDGDANLFDRAIPGLGTGTTIRVNRGEQTVVMPVPEHLDPQEPVLIEFDSAYADSDNVDVCFVVDTTGSMGDELNYIQSELVDVITRANELADDAHFRVAGVVYRDKGDDYVARGEDFGTASEAAAFMKRQGPGGGGDFPEAVEAGLEKALDFDWSESARARILFLVLDAPPHKERKDRIQEATRRAAELGIQVIPISASGVDKSAEQLLRAMAIATNGTYTFLTNHSGIGNDHLEPTVGKYEVELLNEMMVRLILERSVR